MVFHFRNLDSKNFLKPFLALWPFWPFWPFLLGDVSPGRVESYQQQRCSTCMDVDTRHGCMYIPMYVCMICTSSILRTPLNTYIKMIWPSPTSVGRLAEMQLKCNHRLTLQVACPIQNWTTSYHIKINRIHRHLDIPDQDYKRSSSRISFPSRKHSR